MKGSGLDPLAHESAAKNWPPLGKLLLCISLLCGSLLSKTILVPLLVLIISLALLLYSTRGKFPKIFIALALNASMVIIAGVLLIAIVTPGETAYSVSSSGFTLAASIEGITKASLVLVRSLAGFFVLIFFAASTPISHFAAALLQLRIPSYAVEITILIYRYSFMLLELAAGMFVAADCRLGFRGMKNSIRTSGTIAGSLFLRCLDFAGRASEALESRGYNGSFPIYKKPAAINFFWFAFPFLTLILLYIIGNFWSW
ncbi:Cobalt transport protein [Candidatus Anstonella stagnisolia]|nr:Cobalt transport protein [Candidatus Anstonella stagnisolia]